MFYIEVWTRSAPRSYEPAQEAIQDNIWSTTSCGRRSIIFALLAGILVKIPNSGRLDSMSGELAETCYRGRHGVAQSSADRRRAIHHWHTVKPMVENLRGTATAMGWAIRRVMATATALRGASSLLARWLVDRLSRQAASYPDSADGTESVYQTPDTLRGGRQWVAVFVGYLGRLLDASQMSMQMLLAKMYFAQSAGPTCTGVSIGVPKAGKRGAQTEKARAISRSWG